MVTRKEYEIERLESFIKWCKSEKRLIKMLSKRPIPSYGQPILVKRLKEKDADIEKAEQLLEFLRSDKGCME